MCTGRAPSAHGRWPGLLEMLIQEKNQTSQHHLEMFQNMVNVVEHCGGSIGCGKGQSSKRTLGTGNNFLMDAVMEGQFEDMEFT